MNNNQRETSSNMHNEPDIPLKIELLSADEEGRFTIQSKKEIQFILHGIEHKGTLVALYYNDNNNHILTTVLGVSENGVWLGACGNPKENQAIILSQKLVFIGSHYHVKVQFVALKAELGVYKTQDAIHVTLPERILRLQRRDYFRLTTPVKNPLKCVIPVSSTTLPPEQQVTIMDISVGGVALVCEEYGQDLVPGQIYENCHIELPNVGMLNATIQVRNAFEVTDSEGMKHKRAGCEFQGLDGSCAILLQRYISNMQLQSPQ